MLGGLSTFSDSDIIRHSNDVKELVIRDLCEEGHLSRETAEKYLSARVVVGYRPTWLGRAWRRLWDKEGDDHLVLTVVTVEPDPT